MANLKNEVMSLISRFDAAQEAFAANSVEVKALTKKHKKELKAAKAEAKAARIEVEALKAELAILKLGGATAPEVTPELTPAAEPPKAKTSAKRAPGRPKKATTAKVKTTAKRGPGRPRKTKAAPVVAETTTAEETPVEAPVAKKPTAKRGPGRPKKATAAKAKTATKAKSTSTAPKRPGRPRTKPAVAKSALEAIKGVGPAMAAQFEAAGVKTPAAMAKLSNVKMADILAKCGPRYRNADAVKMQTYRDNAAAAK